MKPGDVFSMTSGIGWCRLQVYEVTGVHLGALGQDGVYTNRILNEDDPNVHGHKAAEMSVPIAILDRLTDGK